MTDEERENYACCMKRRLCKDEHFHERDVEAIVAARLAEVQTLAEAPCENFTRGTCADDPNRSPASAYLATGYCWPCRVRAVLAGSVAEVGGR